MIDIGANLAHGSFDEDRETVMQRATDAGVRCIIVTGSSDDSNLRAAELAEASSGLLYATAGVHPHHASAYGDESDAIIRKMIQKDVVIAVGECGLDYFRNLSPRDAQLSAFRRQLEIAKDSALPLFLLSLPAAVTIATCAQRNWRKHHQVSCMQQPECIRTTRQPTATKAMRSFAK